MNSKTIGCEMSVLKRDSENLYDPEVVPFNLEFEFYGDVSGDILRAHATDIMSDIDDAEKLGDWFDSTYDIYALLSDFCGVFNTGAVAVNSVNAILKPVSMVLSATRRSDCRCRRHSCMCGRTSEAALNA